jgi:hypothetical protein
VIQLRLRVLRDENNQIRYSDFRNALLLTDGRLISNKKAHEAISNGINGSNFDHPLWTPFWTRTMIAYPSAHAPFGDALESTDDSGKRLVLDTSKFKGAGNCAIVFDDFQLTAEGNSVVIHPGKISLVQDFPQQGDNHGRFAPDPETGIPVLSGNGNLALWRKDTASIVPVVRAIHNSNLPAIWLSQGLASEFGMIVED